MKISFIGAGNVARALAGLFHRAGHEVLLGAKAGAPAEVGRAVSLEEAASEGEVVVVAVPFLATREVLPALRSRLRGKLVVDATNPVNNDWSPMLLGQENSAGEEVARLLPDARVVKAFNTVFADVMREDRLVRDGQRVTCFVASDDAEASRTVARLAQEAGLAPVPVGPLKMARHLEAMAHLNIQLAVGMKGGTDAAFVYHQRRA
jgi:predicted dinucleotide-binding enzyme